MKKIILSGITLALFALVGNFVVIWSEQQTYDRIQQNIRQALLDNLYQIIDKSQFDNDLIADKVTVKDTLLSISQPLTIYRAWLKGKPSVAIIQAIAPDGYSGSIFLLVGIDYQGKITGVRVTAHSETPGLGDNIDIAKSDWVKSFSNHSLKNPDEKHWAVKKDGGVFDQFSGATISPRAVVKAVKKALIYFQKNKQQIFALSKPDNSSP